MMLPADIKLAVLSTPSAMDKGYDITLHSGQPIKKTSEVSAMAGSLLLYWGSNTHWLAIHRCNGWIHSRALVQAVVWITLHSRAYQNQPAKWAYALAGAVYGFVLSCGSQSRSQVELHVPCTSQLERAACCNRKDYCQLQLLLLLLRLVCVCHCCCQIFLPPKSKIEGRYQVARIYELDDVAYVRTLRPLWRHCCGLFGERMMIAPLIVHCATGICCKQLPRS